jgi:hypothetical protein
MRAINIKQLKQRKYTPVDLGEYTDLLGNIDGKCTIMCYGSSGSGKSTFVLKLSDYLAGKYGKVIYNSHEEKLNKSLQQRVQNYNISNPNLYFAPGWDFETLMDKILKLKYRVVVIDSVQYMKFTYEQLIELKERFSRRNILLILVSFGSTLGKTDGADKLLFASDIKMHFNQGILTSISRYLDKPVKKQLFNPKQTNGGGLFDV